MKLFQILTMFFFSLTLAVAVSADLPAVNSGDIFTHVSADSGVYIQQGGSQASDGDLVGYWQDQSGNGNNANNFDSTGESKPTFLDNAVNGKPVLRFFGANYLDFGFNQYLTQPNTVFLVAYNLGENGYYIDGITSDDRQAFMVADGLNVMWSGSYFWQDHSKPRTWINHTLVYNDTSSQYYTDGVLQAAGSAGASNFGWGLRLGSRYSGSLYGWFYVAEMIIYEGSLTESDITLVNDYLSQKYNITGEESQPVNTGAGTLVAQFDGTDITADGTNVLVWNDQVDDVDYPLDLAAVEVDMGDASGYPQLEQYDFGEGSGLKNVIRFNLPEGSSSGTHLQSSAIPSTQAGPTTFFVVARRDTHGFSSYLFDGISDNARRGVSANGLTDTHRLQVPEFDSVGVDVGVWQVFSAVFNEEFSQLFIDGFTADEYGFSGVDAFEGLTVGSRYSGSNTMDGWIAELLVYEGALDADSRKAVEASLMQKYNITPFCGASYTQYSPMDFDKNCIVNFMDYAKFGQSWLDDFASIGISSLSGIKPSADFAHGWEMDYYPWDVANGVDEDNDGQIDWVRSSSNHFELSTEGTLVNISDVSGSLLANDDNWDQAFWPQPDINAATGFTTEFSIKITSDTGSNGAFKIQVSPYDSVNTDVVFIGASHVTYYVDGGDNIVLDTSDNTDGFHSFRIARHVDEPTKSSVWKDGVLIGDSLDVTWTPSGPHRYYIGDIDSSVNGTYEMDYLRIDPGAWAAPAPMDFDEDGIVGSKDLKSFALDWLNDTDPANIE
ncbi:hypothetical protein SMSP2_00849 [Limihaloglobus sulfuriphilus]|uniref:LamG-like jellyroll fold domain-containing protein n=1 Tax=Limihaloglobus sulfuriphilus TaxID=1851148 RepID=A0A1Q2MDV8_9BACT|nr:LamG domain-containing protein [Limihaloglobus sulfuriphilus]AQQ70497.1 hypothetical protein SMSP2_00849 [Limihaloglobus sulfuriphilus]